MWTYLENLRSYWSRLGLDPATGSLSEKERTHGDTDPEGGRPRGDGGRGWRATGPREVGRTTEDPLQIRQRKRGPPASGFGTSGLQSHESGKEHISLAFSPPVCGGPRKLIQMEMFLEN